ncbi:MAG: hypothetical protein Q9227_007064 [Pyrenula ochraceoflavens]
MSRSSQSLSAASDTPQAHQPSQAAANQPSIREGQAHTPSSGNLPSKPPQNLLPDPIARSITSYSPPAQLPPRPSTLFPPHPPTQLQHPQSIPLPPRPPAAAIPSIHDGAFLKTQQKQPAPHSALLPPPKQRKLDRRVAFSKSNGCNVVVDLCRGLLHEKTDWTKLIQQSHPQHLLTVALLHNYTILNIRDGFIDTEHAGRNWGKYIELRPQDYEVLSFEFKHEISENGEETLEVGEGTNKWLHIELSINRKIEVQQSSQGGMNAPYSPQLLKESVEGLKFLSLRIKDPESYRSFSLENCRKSFLGRMNN